MKRIQVELQVEDTIRRFSVVSKLPALLKECDKSHPKACRYGVEVKSISGEWNPATNDTLKHPSVVFVRPAAHPASCVSAQDVLAISPWVRRQLEASNLSSSDVTVSWLVEKYPRLRVKVMHLAAKKMRAVTTSESSTEEPSSDDCPTVTPAALLERCPRVRRRLMEEFVNKPATSSSPTAFAQWVQEMTLSDLFLRFPRLSGRANRIMKMDRPTFAHEYQDVGELSLEEVIEVECFNVMYFFTRGKVPVTVRLLIRPLFKCTYIYIHTSQRFPRLGATIEKKKQKLLQERRDARQTSIPKPPVMEETAKAELNGTTEPPVDAVENVLANCTRIRAQLSEEERRSITLEELLVRFPLLRGSMMKNRSWSHGERRRRGRWSGAGEQLAPTSGDKVGFGRRGSCLRHPHPHHRFLQHQHPASAHHDDHPRRGPGRWEGCA